MKSREKHHFGNSIFGDSLKCFEGTCSFNSEQIFKEQHIIEKVIIIFLIYGAICIYTM